MHCPTLRELPSPPLGKTGWPWTKESPQVADTMLNSQFCPRISIITPSYNQGEFIEETIRSVLLQGYPNLEYIIIDGGSTDNSIEIIKKYQNYLNYWVSEPDKGPTDAINKGWKRTTGEVITYLNSDDAYFPNALATVGDLFYRHPRTQAICGKQLMINKEGLVLDEYGVAKADHLSLLNLNFIPQPATFIKKAIVDSVGGMDLSIKYTFDFELALRVTRLNSITLVPIILAVTRWHQDTITLCRRSEIGSELVRIIQKEIASYPQDLDQNEKQKILFQVNQLAMNLYFENQKPWGGLKYALKALWLSPSFRSRYHLIKQYYKNLTIAEPITLEEKYFTSQKMKSIHWSSLA